MTAWAIAAGRLTGPSITALIWIVVLFLGLMALYLVVLAIKRRSDAYREGSIDTAFSLHDLRELHRTGQLTDEEYHAARAQVLAAARAALRRDAELASDDDDLNEDKSIDTSDLTEAGRSDDTEQTHRDADASRDATNASDSEQDAEDEDDPRRESEGDSR